LTSTYVVTARARRDQVYSEIADLHVATLASSSPADVISSDRHTVKPWFQGKIPFTFDLPELQNSEFSLLGGRMTYLDQTPGAHLIYQLRRHLISVFVFQEESLRGRLNENSPVARTLSFNMETWSQGGLRYFVIGDAGSADINNLARHCSKPVRRFKIAVDTGGVGIRHAAAAAEATTHDLVGRSCSSGAISALRLLARNGAMTAGAICCSFLCSARARDT
jgi:hypothetical protein